METVTLKITGTSPLLMHNVRLVDPLDPFTRALSAAAKKRSKTEDDHRTLARVEFEGGIYHTGQVAPGEPSKDGDPFVPSAWILKSLRDAAALSKNGKQIERGVIVMEDALPIQYRGPRDVDGLWEAKFYDRRAIGIGPKKTMRTRPRFNAWAVQVTLACVPSVVDRDVLLRSAEQAGAFMGIGDARRLRFGRFNVEAL